MPRRLKSWYALRLPRRRRPAFPHLNLTIAASSDRLTLLMAVDLHHGLKSAKLAHCAPRKIAEAIVGAYARGRRHRQGRDRRPSFINFYLSVAVKNAIFGEARKKGMDFAKSNVGGGLKTRVEFVSANPVGPMHVGHGRWAALGDSLCRVMDHAGYDIQREFYINDHGSQMDTFGNSISTRYMQLTDIIAKQGVDIDGLTSC